ncbi:MAG TPA: hypothetical protein VFV61_10655, partial [Pyrinomonadaceae bacterium]|nr:hypothetical protein [Pyrinomonadaceae bacterium]
MKRVFSGTLSAVILCALIATFATPAGASKGTLATIAGTVSDSKGNPVSGALVSLLKEGAKEISKQMRT